MVAPADRTHCPQNHEYTRENTVYRYQYTTAQRLVKRRVRVCRICRRDQSREAARRRRVREKKQRGS